MYQMISWFKLCFSFGWYYFYLFGFQTLWMTLNAPFKVHTYYIYLLKLSIIPHKIFFFYIFIILTPPPPPHSHTPIVGSCFEEKVANGRTDGQTEKVMDRQSNVCTDRQTDKTYLKNLTWNISSVELKKNCVDVYQCALRHPFFYLATNDAGNSCILMKRFCVRGRCCIFSSFLGKNNFEDMQIHRQWS